MDRVREKCNRKWPPLGQGRRCFGTVEGLCQEQLQQSAATRSPHALHWVSGQMVVAGVVGVVVVLLGGSGGGGCSILL